MPKTFVDSNSTALAGGLVLNWTLQVSPSRRSGGELLSHCKRKGKLDNMKGLCFNPRFRVSSPNWRNLRTGRKLVKARRTPYSASCRTPALVRRHRLRSLACCVALSRGVGTSGPLQAHLRLMGRLTRRVLHPRLQPKVFPLLLLPRSLGCRPNRRRVAALLLLPRLPVPPVVVTAGPRRGLVLPEMTVDVDQVSR